jgi:hypothetical protein
LLTFASRDFGEEEHESSTLQPARLRVAKSVKSSPISSTPPLSPIPTSPNATWNLWANEAHKPLDITKIPGSPHKLPKDFKEWLPIFSGEDLTTPEDHLDYFLRALEPYDQHEDILMKLFAYTFVGRAKEWFDSISPGTIMNWDLFQDIFTKIFGKKKDYQSLYSQLYKLQEKVRGKYKGFQ